MEPGTALEFDQIRPYYDHEVQPVIQRLVTKPSFHVLFRHLFPGLPPEAIARQMADICDTATLQERVISKMVRNMLDQSSEGVTVSGLDALNPATGYLFISNHRDIILDPAILQVLMFEAGLPTSRIAIGDNLMVSNLVTDLMKLNKSFIVHREVERQHFYAHSMRLSRYIHHSITEENASVWIAQRNGRTKDGNDLTQTALLKMVLMAGEGSIDELVCRLNLRPMAISYEWEPCDGLKAEERFHLLAGAPYQKDDKAAMIQGIRKPKGRIHLAIGPDLCDDVRHICASTSNRNHQIRALCDLIDNFVHLNYRLWPGNYLAYEWVTGDTQFANRYSEEEKHHFDIHLESSIANLKGDPDTLRRLLLDMYAYPVANYLRAVEKA